MVESPLAVYPVYLAEHGGLFALVPLHLRLGGMLVAGIAIVATLVKLL